MYQIAGKIRYVLRGLGVLAGFLLLAAGAGAALLPFAIDAEAIRGPLVESLSAWTGGPVAVSGPLRIASFANLSVEASGVDLKSTPDQGPVRFARARSVTAVVRLSSLLHGKLEFKKFVVAAPRVVFRRGFSEPLDSSYGLGAARLALALSARSPFADVELIDPVFFIAARPNGAYERARLSRVKLSKEAAASTISTGVFVANASRAESAFYALDVTAAGFDASFRGQCGVACQTAFGSLRLSADLDTPSGKAILAAMAPWERPDRIALSGEVNLSRKRAALDNASISFGDHAAKGSLALDLSAARPRLEGTIAYDTLDMTTAWTAAHEGQSAQHGLAALPLGRAGMDRSLDFDLRVSAERFRAASLETGPLALALTHIGDRLSVDIASVAVFGGHAIGRLDIAPDKPDAISLRTSGSQLDARALANAFELPLGFAGPVTLEAALTMPMTTRLAPDDLTAAAGSFSIRFPAGGSLEGDMADALRAALADHDLGWGLRAGRFPFAAASIEGSAKPGGVELQVQGQSGGKGIGGSLRIEFPGAAVSGTLLASENLDGASGFEGAADRMAGATKFVLSGTADALILSAPAGKPSLSN